MRHIIQHLRFVTVVLAVSLGVSVSADAAWRTVRSYRRRPHQTTRFVRTTPNHQRTTARQIPDNDWLYPRYTGALHARYFNEMRYPTGDRGLRGTAW